MTRLLITNVHSARNRGDAGIILGMLRGLRARPAFRDADISISSSDPLYDGACYPVPVMPSLRCLCARVAEKPPLPELLLTLVVLPACVVWALAQRLASVDLWLPAALRRVLRAYRDADLVVAAGGGYLYTTSVIRGNAVLAGTVFSFLLGRLLGRPVVLYAQSLGPFAGALQGWLVRRALAFVQLIQVRERRSLELLEGWHLDTAVVTATDAAFLVEAQEPANLAPGCEDMVRIGLTVRGWFRREAAQRRYEGVLAGFVDWLVAEGAEVVFVPQVTHVRASDDDRVVARRVVARLKQPASVRLLDAELTPGEIKGLCRRLRLFVATRMHSAIFALSMGVPTLAIGYLPKTAGLMEDLGLAGWTLPIESLEESGLRDAYARLVAREREVREQLARKIPELTRAAMRNAESVEGVWLAWCRSRGRP